MLLLELLAILGRNREPRCFSNLLPGHREVTLSGRLAVLRLDFLSLSRELSGGSRLIPQTNEPSSIASPRYSLRLGRRRPR